jgi:hypothetical protein
VSLWASEYSVTVTQIQLTLAGTVTGSQVCKSGAALVLGLTSQEFNHCCFFLPFVRLPCPGGGEIPTLSSRFVTNLSPFLWPKYTAFLVPELRLLGQLEPMPLAL